MSDGAAHTYCRCRALPFFIRNLTKCDSNTTVYIQDIFAQMENDQERYAIGETQNHPEKEKWYPPNAFHTYWALEVLDALRDRFETEFDALKMKLKVPVAILIARMRQWARESLGYQDG